MSLMTTSRTAPSVPRPSLALLLTVLLAAAVLTGCGGGGVDSDTVVAKVGDRVVTVADYELMLSKLQPNELPVGEDGVPLDMASEAGKRAFLDMVVNKELMAAKAVDLGFDQDQTMVQANTTLLENFAPKLMYQELNQIPSQNVTDAEIDAYYENQKTVRNVHFMICNFESDALEARRRLMDGELWEDVAAEFNDGSKGPTGDYTLQIQWGRTEDAFENVVFNLDVGEISEPFDTVYGWWVIRLDSIGENRVPELTDQQRERIRQTLQARKSNLMNAEFVAQSRAKHELKLDETALWLIYNGMPEEEPYLDPETNKPVPQGNLKQLDVPTEELDRVFFSVKFDLDGEPEVWTIGDYKAQYDQWNVFQRPKRGELLGGVRKKILNDMVDRRLMISEARERGYFERPEVTGDVNMNVERAMVQKLHDEVVKIDERISPEALDAFWNEHRD
ncbi:SurA N-terminal domain-containing protein, partial [bacterium]|nr:SurA N-terminal domain-containing protein [bacterium]